MNAQTTKAPLRIGIDGFNIAMSRGTGVATYGRVLSRCLTAMGHPVDVLYGLPMSENASAVMSEVAFFDRLEQGGRRAPSPSYPRGGGANARQAGAAATRWSFP